jgi:hypothetical protein
MWNCGEVMMWEWNLKMNDLAFNNKQIITNN